MRIPIYINGRFLTQPVTGVQRFAGEALSGLDALRDSDSSRWLHDATVLAPKGEPLGPNRWRIPVRRVGHLSGHAWEQLELPWFARDGLLVNLCNTAPLLKRRQLTVMHDAAVFAVPDAYSVAFRWWYRLMFWVVARAAQRVATVSEFSRQELARHLRLPPGRFELLPESGDHIRTVDAQNDILARHGLSGRRFVLAVSSLSPHKNFRAVVRAIESMGEVDCEFVIAGGVNPRVFASDPERLGARVKHIGYVSDGQLRALYENAHCLVYPSRYEGFGLPPLEAMVCGCPVIVAQAASLPEVCGLAALYCDPDDPLDLAKRLRQILSDDSLRARLSVAGRERAAQFTWSACAARLAEIVQSARARGDVAFSRG